MIYYLAHSTSKSIGSSINCVHTFLSEKRTGNRDADQLLDPAERVRVNFQLSQIPDMAIKRMTSHFILTM